MLKLCDSPLEMSFVRETRVMKEGDVVKYSRSVGPEEADFRFVVLSEPENGRVDIQLICDERIRPIETVAVEEVEPA